MGQKSSKDTDLDNIPELEDEDDFTKRKKQLGSNNSTFKQANTHI